MTGHFSQDMEEKLRAAVAQVERHSFEQGQWAFCGACSAGERGRDCRMHESDRFKELRDAVGAIVLPELLRGAR